MDLEFIALLMHSKSIQNCRQMSLALVRGKRHSGRSQISDGVAVIREKQPAVAFLNVYLNLIVVAVDEWRGDAA
jgi:hypothetical protein